MGSLTITAAQQADMPEVDTLYEAVGWLPPRSIRSRDTFLLARRGGQLAGAVLYWVDDEPDLLPDEWTDTYGDSARVLVHEIAVAPDRHRTGVGRALMAATARAAAEIGVPYLWTRPSPLGTVEQRDGRVAFFARCGMSEFRPGNDIEMVGGVDDILTAPAPLAGRPAPTAQRPTAGWPPLWRTHVQAPGIARDVQPQQHTGMHRHCLGE